MIVNLQGQYSKINFQMCDVYSWNLKRPCSVNKVRLQYHDCQVIFAISN